MHLTHDPIIRISLSRVDVPMRDDFVISKGRVKQVQNLYLKLETQEGLTGYGEITPFPELDGDDRASNERYAEQVAAVVLGQNSGALYRLSRELKEAFPRAVATRCGFEMALLDLHARRFDLPLYMYLGGASHGPLSTDVTIPILAFDRCLELTRLWYERGFRTFKVKVGKDLGEDVAKVMAMAKLYPDIHFLLDANQGYDLAQAKQALEQTKSLHHRILAFEQPVDRLALSDLAQLHECSPLPIVADEAVTTMEELLAVIRLKAASWVNIKIMKSGVLEGLQIAQTAQRAGLGLMMGGMIETRMAVGCSFALALGLGHFRLLDLDAPLLMHDDPVDGGFTYEGASMSPCSSPGLGMTPWGVPIWTKS